MMMPNRKPLKLDYGLAYDMIDVNMSKQGVLKVLNKFIDINEKPFLINLIFWL